jgi:hypothetical protein
MLCRESRHATKPFHSGGYQFGSSYRVVGTSPEQEDRLVISMMAAIYATLLIAFVLDLLGRRRLAACCLSFSFILCVWLFLWEIYSPEYGFRMPWLQVELGPIIAPLRSV